MNSAVKFTCLTALVLALGTTFVGCDAGSRKSMIIQQVIAGANAKKAEMLRMNQEVGDINVYRDGELDGVVFEYTFQDGFEVADDFNSETAKPLLLAEFKNEPDTKKVLAQDIFVRFIYKKIDGSVVADVKLEKGDL